MSQPDDQLDDLAQACRQAPAHGLNAKTLILQAALQQDDEPQEETARKRRRRQDPSAEAAEAAARRGANYLAAVEPKQRPRVPYLARSKIPRINRQTVLSKLAGEHLALAAHRQRQPPLRPQAAAADLELRRAAFEAAAAQEADLYARCATGLVYQNLAARTNATQWQQAQQQPAAEVWQEQQESEQTRQQAQQQQQQGRAAGGGSVKAVALPPESQTQQAQPASPGSAGGEQPPAEVAGAAADAPAPPSSSRAVWPARQRLVDADIDHEAAVSESMKAEAGAADAEASPAAEATVGPATAPAAAANAAKTELGCPSFRPLSKLLTAAAAREAPAPGAAARSAALQREGLAAPDTEATAAIAVPAGAAAAAGPAATPAAAATCDAVHHQVELFIRAELHPLLKRQQVSQEVHDAVCARSASKVMQRHAGATSADFLVAEGASIRALVRSYLQHLQKQAQQVQQAHWL